MKRFYQILSLILLALCGITPAVAQDYEQGELLTDMNDIVGKEVLIWSPGISWDHPTGYLNGTSTYTSRIGDENIYTFELVDGETVDGHALYRLKQVSTGLYYKDAGAITEDSEDTPVEMTANVNEAYKFTSLLFEENGEDPRTKAIADKQDLSQEGFIFARYAFVSADAPTYLGGVDVPFWSPYVDTNVWLIYSLNRLSGYDKLYSYVDYYFPSGIDGYTHGTNPGEYDETAWQAANVVYEKANNMLAESEGSHTAAEYDAMCAQLKEAAVKLQAAVNPITAGYYFIHDSRGTINYLYTRTLNGNELIGSGNYTEPETLGADDAKYIWYVEPGTKDGLYTIKNYYTESYITGQKTGDRFNLGQKAEIGVAKEGQVSTPSYLLYVPQTDASNHSQQLNTSNGYIVSWNNQPTDAGNCFHFISVSAADIEALEALVRQQALNERMQNLYTAASQTKAENDGSLGLVSNANSLSSNAACPNEGSLAGLLDDNTTTYFHTDWTGTNNPDAYHYLQADLGTAVKGVRMTYSQRYRSAANRGNSPAKIEAYATNNVDGEWTDLGTFDMTYTTPVVYVNSTKTDTLDNAAGELTIDFEGTAYRFFRFEVMEVTAGDAAEKTSAGYPFWYLSELRLFSTEEGGTTNYSVVPADIRSAFETQLDAAKAALEAGTATAEGIDALQAAYDALVAALPDPSRITALVNTARETAKKAAVGETPGYYPQSSLDALNAAITTAENAAKPGMAIDEINAVLNTLQAAIDNFGKTLILPTAGEFYYLRSASESKAYGNANGYNSKEAAVYSSTNAVSGALRFTQKKNASDYTAGELVDSIDLNTQVKYLWYVEKSGEGKIVLRNVGTGMYLANTVTNNNAAAPQSTEPVELNVIFNKAGAFSIEIGNGFYLNAQGGGAVVAWSSATDDNGSWTFQSASKDNYADPTYYWAVTPGQYQIITLPVSIDSKSSADGTIYTLVGQSDDRKLVLAEATGTIEAGTPFIFKAEDEVKDDNNRPWAYFETADGALADLDGLFNYNFTPKSVDGLTGTIAQTDTCRADRAYFDNNGSLRLTKSGKVAIGANSGYFNGQHTTGVSAEGAAATIDIPEGGDITGISQNVVVLPSVVNVYSLNGTLLRKNVKAASAVSGLPAGIYIVGGQKVLVK